MALPWSFVQTLAASPYFTPLARHRLHGEPVGAVGPGIADHPHVLSDEVVFGVDPSLERDRLRMARPGASEHLLARQLQAYRVARGERQMGDDVLYQRSE